MPEIDVIVDTVSHRSIAAAVAASPGSIAIENVAGTLKQVDDQGNATSLGTLNVANYAALAAAPAGTYTAGQVAFVSSGQALFLLMTSAAAARTNVRIAASGLAGAQWVRIPMRNPYWEVQSTWTIDPTNSTGLASDDNIGSSSAAPLLTWTEHSLRLASAEIAQATTTTVLGDQQAGDNPTYTYVVRGGILMSFVGSPTVLHASTVTSYAAATFGAIAAADDCELGDTAVSGGSWTAAGALAKGVRVRRTNGTAIYAFFLKDLGGTTARLSQPFNPAAATTQPVFVAADSYNIEQLPKILSVRFTDIQAITGTKLDSFDWRAAGVGVPPVWFLNCYFSTWTSNVLWLGGLMQNSCMDTGGLTFSGGPKMTFTCGAFKGTGATLYSLNGPFNFEGNLTCCQGVQFNVANGAMQAFQLNAYDCTAAAFIHGDTNGRLHFLVGGIGGKGNTGLLVSMGQGSQCLSGTNAIASGAFYNSASTSDLTPIAASGVAGVGPIPLDASLNGVFTTAG